MPGRGRGGSRAPEGRGAVPTLGAGRKEGTDQEWRLDGVVLLTTGQGGSTLPRIEKKLCVCLLIVLPPLITKGFLMSQVVTPPISSDLRFQS